ncbi:MAG: lamin tail domain-containing protein [Pseudomonadota bacterium]
MRSMRSVLCLALLAASCGGSNNDGGGRGGASNGGGRGGAAGVSGAGSAGQPAQAGAANAGADAMGGAADAAGAGVNGGNAGAGGMGGASAGNGNSGAGAGGASAGNAGAGTAGVSGASTGGAGAGTSGGGVGGSAAGGSGGSAGVGGSAALAVSSVSPSTSALANTALSVAFNRAVSAPTLSAQTAVGACSGSIQVSANDFVSCAGFASAAPELSDGNTLATLVPVPGLLVNRLYKIRVTTAVAGADQVALAAQYTSAGFTTSNPLADPAGRVVISQVYGGGGETGALYKNDFIELHNSSTQAVNLAGWSVQYGAATGVGWEVTTLLGTIAPGAYFLIREGTAGAGNTLPGFDATGAIALAATAGKVALVNNAIALGGACPSAVQIVDMIGYGVTNCSEQSPAQAPAANGALIRRAAGCTDANNNLNDFSSGLPTPRISASAFELLCPAPALNETGLAGEIDYCAVASQASLTGNPGQASPAILASVFETGVTEAAGANSALTAQFGYGPISANPEYEPGWSWVPATFNAQASNNDVYQATFSMPSSGSYRYAYRVSLDNGTRYTYCDTNQHDAGAGSNANLTFDLEDQGVLTVSP